MERKISDYDRNFDIQKRLQGILHRQEELQELLKQKNYTTAERNLEYAIIYTKLVAKKVKAFK